MWQLPQATPDVECDMLAYKAENAGRQAAKDRPEG